MSESERDISIVLSSYNKMNIKKLIIHTIIFWWSAFFMNWVTFAQTPPAAPAWQNVEWWNGCKGLTDWYTFIDTNFQNSAGGYKEDCMWRMW